MIRIYQASDLPQAHLIINLLMQNGIKAQMTNVNAQSGVGEIPFTHAYPEIWIEDEANLKQARKLIVEFEKPLDNKQWFCRYCHEPSPETFEVCWNCNRKP